MFQNTLRNLRESKDLSQSQLAEILSVTRGAVTKWENGLSSPRLAKVQEIADFFGVSVSDLLNDELDELTEQEVELISIFRQLDETKKAVLLQTMKAML